MTNCDTVGLKKRDPEALASFKVFLKGHCDRDMELYQEALSSMAFSIADDDTIHASTYMFDETFTFTSSGWDIAK